MTDHEFPAFWPDGARLLILGSFPSVKSRETGFYYGHPQNRFWRVLAAVYGESLPETVDEKKSLLIRRKIALWDSVERCEIVGSSDSSIRMAVPADISGRLAGSDVGRIILNGRTAEKYFYRFNKDVSAEVVSLPSTSPANAAWSLERLTAAWKKELL